MNTDIASIAIEQNAETVFNFMSDPNNMDLWSFGTWRIKVNNDGLVHGRSIFDGSAAFVRIQPTERNYLIDYWVGSDSEHLVPRIFVRITSGEVIGSGFAPSAPSSALDPGVPAPFEPSPSPSSTTTI